MLDSMEGLIGAARPGVDVTTEIVNGLALVGESKAGDTASICDDGH